MDITKTITNQITGKSRLVPKSDNSTTRVKLLRKKQKDTLLFIKKNNQGEGDETIQPSTSAE